MKIFAYLSALNKWLFHKMGGNDNDSIIAKQRIYVFVYSSAAALIGIIANLFGIGGPKGLYFAIANSINGIIALALLPMVRYKKIDTSKALITLTLVTQFAISSEQIYLAIQNTHYSINLITANLVLSAFIVLLMVISYIKYMPLIISFVSMVSLGVCIYITGNEDIANIFFPICLCFILFALLGIVLVKQVSTLQGENLGLKEEHMEVLHLFDMKQEELHAYIALSKQRGLSAGRASELLSVVSEKSREIIQQNVAYMMEQKQIKYTELETQLPMLSASEIEICMLILEGKKLREISKTLEKSESNISCQRSNIRTKLGLGKGEDLRTRLLQLTTKEGNK